MNGFRCLRCKSELFHPVYSQLPDRFYNKPGLFNLVTCNKCKLMQLEKIPENLGDYYSNYKIHDKQTKLYSLLQYFLVGRNYPTFGSKVGNLLDYGCGNGWYLVSMKKKGWCVTGCEYGEQYTKELEQRINIPIKTPSTLVPDYINYFDAVAFNFSFEHLQNPVEVLQIVYQLLKKGGVVKIMVPNIEGIEARIFRDLWYHLDPPRHITFFSKKQLQDILMTEGFQHIKVKNVSVPTGFAGSLSYLIFKKWKSFVWYPAVLPGIIFSFFIRDGNFSIEGVKG